MACESSGTVRSAFREKGHEAFSVDILPSDDNSKYHIQDDVRNHLLERWDLMIAHPPCTFMCNSGVSWLHKDDSRWDELKKAYEFFLELKNSNIPKIAIENPIPHKYATKFIGRYNQVLQPYQYGHPEQKATCLWLKNLPRLIPTDNKFYEMKKLPKSEAQRIHMTPPGPDRWKIRSKTFDGIANAMSEQWGNKPLQTQLSLFG